MLHARKDYQNRIIDTAELIPENEPVFLLRGKDMFAPGLLLDYAKQLRLAGGDPDMAAMVESHAQAMIEYQRSNREIMVRNGRIRLPDVPQQYEVVKLESEEYQDSEGGKLWYIDVQVRDKNGKEFSMTKEALTKEELEEIQPGYKFEF